MSASDLFKKIDRNDQKDMARYRTVLQVKHLLVGGVPSDPSVIRGWIRSRMELGDAAIEELVSQTVDERGVLTPDEAVDVVMSSELAPSANGFKRDRETGELLVEGRTLKAALKEFANSAYPGKDYPGKTSTKTDPRRGLLKNFVERVFVEETFIGTGVKASDVAPEPTPGAVAWVEERIKHITNAGKPASAINRVEVILQPRIEFTVRVHDDFLPQEAWGRIWQRGEDIGIGADRGRSDGMFELVTWEKIK